MAPNRSPAQARPRRKRPTLREQCATLATELTAARGTLLNTSKCPLPEYARNEITLRVRQIDRTLGSVTHGS